VKTAQQAQTNYQNSGGRAQADWLAGIQSTQKDQAALAIAAGARYIQGVQDAYSAGITAGAGNYGVAAQKVMSAIAQGVSNLPPRGDINANLQRSASLAMYLHGLKGTLGA
jgi:hypothetical protein